MTKRQILEAKIKRLSVQTGVNVHWDFNPYYGGYSMFGLTESGGHVEVFGISTTNRYSYREFISVLDALVDMNYWMRLNKHVDKRGQRIIGSIYDILYENSEADAREALAVDTAGMDVSVNEGRGTIEIDGQDVPLYDIQIRQLY